MEGLINVRAQLDQQSLVINIMKGVLAILVVALHTSIDSNLCWYADWESFLRVLICKIGGIAVPSFFLISGYFFFNKLDDWNWIEWKNKLKKRLKTLLVPYFLWIIIALVAKYFWLVAKGDISIISILSFKDFFFDSGALRIFWDRPYNTQHINIFGCTLGTSKPINAPLWYIRDLYLLTLIAPLLWIILRKFKGWALFALFILNIFDIGFPFTLFSPTAIFYFCFGAYFSINNLLFINIFRRYSVPSYYITFATLIGTLFLDTTPFGDIVFKIFVAFGVISCFSITDYLSVKKKIKELKILTNASFFIYASHTVLITEISNFILWRTMPFTTEFVLLLKVFLRPIVAITFCLLILFGLKYYCPKTLKLLTGGRGR